MALRALYLAVVLASIATTQGKGHLRPRHHNQAKHIHEHSKKSVSAVQVKKQPEEEAPAGPIAPPSVDTAPVDTGAVTTEAAAVASEPVMPRAEAPAMPKAEAPAMPKVEAPVMPVSVVPTPHEVAKQGQSPAVKQLNTELAEVKQMRVNVQAVEKALAADVALLRETAALQKVASTPLARQAAKSQLHQAEDLVKATEAMVLKSRQDAVERAKSALADASEVSKVANELFAEAKVQAEAVKPVKPVKQAAATPTVVSAD